MKTVFQTNSDGYFTGPTEADASPLEPGVYLIPAGAVEIAPPPVGPDKAARWVNGVWLIVPAPQQATPGQPPEVPADPYEILSDLRWRRETGGITLPDGTEISTTRESQSLIIGTVLGIQTGLITGPVTWKARSGWVNLTGPEIIALAAAVAQHVQKCFAAERATSVMLETLQNDPALDIEAAFNAAFAAV
jgi:hypothetical protein